MADNLTFREHTSSVWKPLKIVFLTTAILFTILFWQFNDPLWTGIFRLLAFVGFAGLLLAFLQTRQRTNKIELIVNKSQLQVNYYRNAKKQQEELFEMDTIKQINKEPAPVIWLMLPRNDCQKFIISFTDSRNTLSLFRFESRDIYVSLPDAKKTAKFLASHNLVYTAEDLTAVAN